MSEQSRIQVGDVVQFESSEEDGGLVAGRVVRMDTPTSGVVEMTPPHGQGIGPYRVPFSTLDVVEE